MEISGKTPNRPKRRNGPGLLALAPLTLLLSTRAIAGITAAQELPATLQELFLEGVQAEKAGNLDLAEKDFLQVLRRQVAPPRRLIIPVVEVAASGTSIRNAVTPTVIHGRFAMSSAIVRQSKKWSRTIHTMKCSVT